MPHLRPYTHDQPLADQLLERLGEAVERGGTAADPNQLIPIYVDSLHATDIERLATELSVDAPSRGELRVSIIYELQWEYGDRRLEAEEATKRRLRVV